MKSVVALVGCLSLGAGGAAAAQDGLVAAIGAGRPILESKVRYETVDQQGFADEASALSVRTRLGWETGVWRDLRGLIEFEDVRAGGDYNDGAPPAEPYPVIADPEVTELNRAQLTWTPDERFGATVGRQRISFDDQRFVGASGWRQDEQTFDSARADVKAAGFTIATAWVGHVNRVFGEELDWRSDSWLVNASHKGAEWLRPTLFVYALDLDEAPTSSGLTTGVRVIGKAKVGAMALNYAASLARQTDYGNAPTSFDLGYGAAELAGTYKLATVRGAYEVLEGDGLRGFQTPLATLHAFQGWADVFLTTPADGIEDRNISLTLRPRKLELTARHHAFEAQRTGAPLGEELDLLVSAPLGKRFTAVAKYADYDGVTGYADRRKVWFSLEFKL